MNVLLYGEDTSARAALLDVLTDRNHDLTVVENTKETVETVARLRPDMVVLAPSSIHTVALVNHIRDELPHSLIIVTGVPPSPIEVHALFDAGADDCILEIHRTPRLNARFDFIEKYVAAPPPRLISEEHAKQAQQQEAVAEIGRRALAGTERIVLMAIAVRMVADVMEVPMCKVLKHRPEARQFLLKAGVGWKPGLVGTTCVGDGVDSQAGYTLGAPDPVVVEDFAEEDRFDTPKLLRDHDVRVGVSVAIPSTPEPYGVLGVHDTEARTFSEDDVYFLQSIANVLAGAVERSRTEKALRDSEAKARAIVETTVDAIITIDDDGIIESFNQAAEEIFGYDAEEVIGENVKVLMPQPYRDEHDGYIRSYHETGRRRIIGIGREVTGLRKDGTTFPMDLAVSEVELEDRHIFTGIIRDISERRQLETEILDISEQERRRIGQDLHDGLGQMLTGIGLLSQNLTRQLRNEDHELTSESAEITSLMREADQYARDLARGLTPVDLDADGLSQALQRLSDNAVRLFDVECVFEEVNHPLVHDSTAATHLYRIAQEAVSNAVRHGDAETIRILLAAGPHQIRLRIRDDGSGFDPAEVDGPGMGVNIMNYRARIIGGTLEISSDLGDGTVVTCTLPNTTRKPVEPKDELDAPSSPPLNDVFASSGNGQSDGTTEGTAAGTADGTSGDEAASESSQDAASGESPGQNRRTGSGCPFHASDD